MMGYYIEIKVDELQLCDIVWMNLRNIMLSE